MNNNNILKSIKFFEGTIINIAKKLVETENENKVERKKEIDYSDGNEDILSKNKEDEKEERNELKFEKNDNPDADIHKNTFPSEEKFIEETLSEIIYETETIENLEKINLTKDSEQNNNSFAINYANKESYNACIFDKEHEDENKKLFSEINDKFSQIGYINDNLDNYNKDFDIDDNIKQEINIDKDEDISNDQSGLILNFSQEGLDDLDRKSVEYGAKANELAKKGLFNEAKKYYTLAISLNNNDFRYYCNRSFCYEHLKQYKQALADADKAICLLPFRPKPHLMRSKALIGLKRFEEAERELKLIQKMDPECREYDAEMIRLRNFAFFELGFEPNQSVLAAQRYDSIQDAVCALIDEKQKQIKPLVKPIVNQLSIEPEHFRVYDHIRNNNNNDNNNKANKKRVRKIYRQNYFNSNTETKKKQDFSSGDSFDLYPNYTLNYNINYRQQQRSKKENETINTKLTLNARIPINIFGYKALWIGNVSAKCLLHSLQKIFCKFGSIVNINVVKESFCAFICYDNPHSPCLAIYNLFNKKINGISNGNRPLRLRFAAGKDQDRHHHKHAKRKSTEECYFWRTTGCVSEKCKRLHLPMCRGIDYQPWMAKDN